MANQEHLDMLRKGVGEWNVWRERHDDVRPNLNDADLSGANLSRANLGGSGGGPVKLIGTRPHGATLHIVNLTPRTDSRARRYGG